MDLDDVRDDLSAFADDPADVEVDKKGSAMLLRGGQEISFNLREENGKIIVVQDQSKTAYREFLAHNIAGLGTFAERLSSKRTPVQAFVNGPARVESVSLGAKGGSSIELLDMECGTISPFSSKVVFITGDAGHGKTALLREYQSMQASRFLRGKNPFIFWHVDLQGRQLLRLHEALMGDLGELRIAGLWMAGIVRLLKHGLLVLAIDGFDELAAEQGRTDALGALAMMVQQMQDRGIIVAASRRTFFDTEDYARRTGLLRRRVSNDCEFDQIHLLDWTRTEAVEYLSKVSVNGRKIPNPNEIYHEILEEVQNDPSHPMLSRPFLLTHLTRGLLLYDATPSEFMKSMEKPLEGVAEVVKAFIQREVSEKWKMRDTGEPYLTVEQHMQLLATVAQEMWFGQVDRLPIDVIETLVLLLLDDWKIEEDRRRQIIDMVRMHVLLVIPSDGDASTRSFDHPEFRNYFVAYSLAGIIKRVLDKQNASELGRVLSVAQLPDGVARYAATMFERTFAFVKSMISLLNDSVAKEWKPTFLQNNVGTLIPCLLNGSCGDEVLEIRGNVVFSSLIFERTHLKNITFRKANFLNVSIVGVHWENIDFRECDVSEMTLDKHGSFETIRMVSCNIHQAKLIEGDEELARGYSPERIREILNSVGIEVVDDGEKQVLCPALENEQRKLANRLLRIFRRTTVVSDYVLTLKFQSQQQKVLYERIIPLMEKYGIIELRPWRGGGKARNLWGLKKGLEEILRADCGKGDRDIVKFWNEIDKL